MRSSPRGTCRCWRSRPSRHKKVHALKAGARDFISKPFDVEEVLTRIRNMVEIRLLHEDARSAANSLEILAQQDPLTGLVNRRLLTS